MGVHDGVLFRADVALNMSAKERGVGRALLPMCLSLTVPVTVVMKILC